MEMFGAERGEGEYKKNLRKNIIINLVHVRYYNNLVHVRYYNLVLGGELFGLLPYTLN